MLNVHCNTVQRGGKGKMKGDSHPLACQHSGRWHLFLRFGNLIKLGTSLGHKTDIPILGSKQRLNLQGQHEGLAGKGGPPTDSCLGAHSSCSWSEMHTGVQRPSGRRRDGCHWGFSCIAATVLSMHRPALAKDGSHKETRGYHRLKRDGHGNPWWMLLPPIHPTPPNLSKAPFTVCSLK